jgi:hypothetical protein
MFSFVLLLATSASATVVNTQYDSGTLARFPIAFGVSHTNRTIPGIARIDLFRSNPTLMAVEDFPLNSAWHEIDTIILADGLDQVAFEGEVSEPSNGTTSGFAAHVGASIISDFTRERFGFLTTPVSRDAGQLVISPHNAPSYAYGGDLFYSQNEHAAFWAVPIAMRMISSSSEEPIGTETAADDLDFQTCTLLSIGRQMFLPREIVDDLLFEFQRLGVVFSISRVYDGITDVVLHHLTDQIIRSLPRMQFLVRDQYSDLISIAVINPREYLEDDPFNASSKSLLFKSRFGSSCTLGPLVLSKVVVHFDAQNHRVGFGEPLADLEEQ